MPSLMNRQFLKYASQKSAVNSFACYQTSQKERRSSNGNGDFTKNFAFANIQSSARSTATPNKTDLKINLLYSC